jgi:hypothetical protein
MASQFTTITSVFSLEKRVMAGFRFLSSSFEILKSFTLARLRSSYSGDLSAKVQKHVRLRHGLLSSTKTIVDNFRPSRWLLLARHIETVEKIHCPTASRTAPRIKPTRRMKKSIDVKGLGVEARSPLRLSMLCPSVPLSQDTSSHHCAHYARSRSAYSCAPVPTQVPNESERRTAVTTALALPGSSLTSVRRPKPGWVVTISSSPRAPSKSRFVPFVRDTRHELRPTWRR